MQAVGTSDECKSYDPAVTKYGDGLSRALATKIYSHIAYGWTFVQSWNHFTIFMKFTFI